MRKPFVIMLVMMIALFFVALLLPTKETPEGTVEENQIYDSSKSFDYIKYYGYDGPLPSTRTAWTQWVETGDEYSNKKLVTRAQRQAIYELDKKLYPGTNNKPNNHNQFYSDMKSIWKDITGYFPTWVIVLFVLGCIATPTVRKVKTDGNK